MGYLAVQYLPPTLPDQASPSSLLPVFLWLTKPLSYIQVTEKDSKIYYKNVNRNVSSLAALGCFNMPGIIFVTETNRVFTLSINKPPSLASPNIRGFSYA